MPYLYIDEFNPFRTENCYENVHAVNFLMTLVNEKIFSRKLLENLDEIFPRYFKHSDKFSMVTFSTTNSVFPVAIVLTTFRYECHKGVLV